MYITHHIDLYLQVYEAPFFKFRISLWNPTASTTVGFSSGFSSYRNPKFHHVGQHIEYVLRFAFCIVVIPPMENPFITVGYGDDGRPPQKLKLAQPTTLSKR
jgi:hypothetical protein